MGIKTYIAYSFVIVNFFSLSLFSKASAIEELALFRRQHREFPIVLRDNIGRFHVSVDEAELKIEAFCKQLDNYFKMYRWRTPACGGNIKWKANLVSSQQNPLLYLEIGSGSDVTLFLGGVHPDEITPVYVAFELAEYLTLNPSIVANSQAKVVIAPLVNPDGFFKKGATRTNSNGVDLNRNFFTKDWYARAKSWWAERRSQSSNHFPGHLPNSEIETLFQIQLIDKFKPSKIISLHAPLGFYDYDGPGTKLARPLTESEQKAKKLVHAMSKSSENYRIVEYSYYPGSLGNYAGIERSIPTVTLELESTDPRKAEEYWLRFRPSLEQSLHFKVEIQNRLQGPATSLFLNMYNLALGN